MANDDDRVEVEFLLESLRWVSLEWLEDLQEDEWNDPFESVLAVLGTGSTGFRFLWGHWQQAMRKASSGCLSLREIQALTGTGDPWPEGSIPLSTLFAGADLHDAMQRDAAASDARTEHERRTVLVKLMVLGLFYMCKTIPHWSADGLAVRLRGDTERLHTFTLLSTPLFMTFLLTNDSARPPEITEEEWTMFKDLTLAVDLVAQLAEEKAS